MSTNIPEIWQNIVTWLNENGPEVMAQFPAAAEPAAITEAEKATNCTFPEEYRDFLRIHDGDGGVFVLGGKWSLHSLEEAVTAYEEMARQLISGEFDGLEAECEDDDVMRPVYWSTRWIPIGDDGSGGLLCLDLDPEDDGIEGQVIYADRYGARMLVAIAVDDLLNMLWLAIEAGDVEVEDDGIEADPDWWLVDYEGEYEDEDE